MKYVGSVIKGSLLDEAFLNFADAEKEAGGLITFEVGDEMVASVAEEMSKSLKSGASYGVIKNEFERMIIFPNKIFKYSVKDAVTRQKAVDYGKTLGIPEVQLDFK